MTLEIVKRISKEQNNALIPFLKKKKRYEKEKPSFLPPVSFEKIKINK